MSTANTPGWRWRHLLLAPHRLGFFLAMAVLATSGLWWAAVQADRATGWLSLSTAMPPTVLHSVVMVFGFVPLFFAGFLFTAGPKWLAVPAPSAKSVAAPLLVQASGWGLWLAGGHLAREVALAGLVLAAAGLAGMAWRFLRMVLQSRTEDRVHAKAVAAALVVGTGSIAALATALLLNLWDLARPLVHTGLWGFVVAVYVSVAHRMIPFFTSSALPFIRAWRPFWVLSVLLFVAAFEAVAAWAEFAGITHVTWLCARAGLEFVAGAVVLYLAWAWGLVQSLKVRLLGMLHLGFAWLGLGLVLSSLATGLSMATGSAMLPLGSLHAVTMGCLGTLMLAMVTRVSCGHGGRPLVADNFIWTLFLLLQAATVLRVAATLPLAGPGLLLSSAIFWGAAMSAWALRLGIWYGQPRIDGRPG